MKKIFSIKRIIKVIKIVLAYIFLALPAFVCALFAKIFIRDLWLVYESGRLARDNGFSFFKYLREKHPEQKVVFVISKKSPDYNKVASLGKTCGFRTFSHWFYYFVCSKEISSHPHFKPGYYLNKNLWLNKTYFLQHGITRDMTGYTGDGVKFKLFVTSAKREQEYIINNYNFKDTSIIKLLGFPRFDNLLNSKVDKDQILIMPTWRGEYLADCTENQFKDSVYFKTWFGLLNDKKLHEMLKKYNKKIVFYPHIEMQKYVHLFNMVADRISICDAGTSDVQSLLKESALLITDYSSVFFDFAYMKKPVLWYVFDEKDYYEKHHNKGYFDHRDNILGVCVDKKEQLLAEIERLINNNFTLSEKQIKDVEDFFEFFDGKNCERVYQAIKNTK